MRKSLKTGSKYLILQFLLTIVYTHSLAKEQRIYGLRTNPVFPLSPIWSKFSKA